MRREDEQEMYNLMQQMIDVYEAAPDFMKKTMEPVIKITFHIKELSDEFNRIDAKDLDIYTEQLKKIDRHLVRAIKATKEITDERDRS